eukprot:299799_1
MSYNFRKKKESEEPNKTYTDTNGIEYKWACCDDESLPAEDAIGCDGVDLHGEQCIYWTHFTCAGFNQNTINLLQKGNTEITFFCKYCKKKMNLSTTNGNTITNKPKKKINKKKPETLNSNNSNKSENNKQSETLKTPKTPMEIVAQVVEMRWVQCDKCGKWRRIPTSVPDSEFEGEWTCDKNKW